MSHEPPWTSQPYRYRVEEVAPGISWHEGNRGSMRGSPFPYVPFGWTAWVCLTGEHRYHRTKAASQLCAGIIPPRIEYCKIIGGDVSLDPPLVRSQRA